MSSLNVRHALLVAVLAFAACASETPGVPTGRAERVVLAASSVAVDPCQPYTELPRPGQPDRRVNHLCQTSIIYRQGGEIGFDAGDGEGPWAFTVFSGSVWEQRQPTRMQIALPIQLEGEWWLRYVVPAGPNLEMTGPFTLFGIDFSVRTSTACGGRARAGETRSLMVSGTVMDVGYYTCQIRSHGVTGKLVVVFVKEAPHTIIAIHYEFANQRPSFTSVRSVVQERRLGTVVSLEDIQRIIRGALVTPLS